MSNALAHHGHFIDGKNLELKHAVKKYNNPIGGEGLGASSSAYSTIDDSGRSSSPETPNAAKIFIGGIGIGL